MSTELHERIQRRAYELWQQEGRPEGRADDHWSRAEAELQAEATNLNSGGEGSPGVAPGSRRNRGPRRRGASSPAEQSPSDLAADEAAKGGGGTGP